MVKKLDVETCQCGCETDMYQCETCGFMFSDSNMAQKCENFCNENHACSIEITKHGIKCC